MGTESDQNEIEPGTTPSGQETDVSAPSSGDTGGEPTLFDAISEAGSSSDPDEQPQETEEPAAAGDADPEQAAPETAQVDDGTPLADEPTEAELSAMNARTKRRIEQLLAERKAARDEAQKSRFITEYMARNDIPPQDVEVVLGMAAQLRRGDFAGFLRTVDPYVKLAQQYTGQILPPDLEQQVRQGYVAENVARELAQRRAAEQVQQQRAQRQAQVQEQEVRNLRGQAIRTAVTNWETQVRGSDPDYEAKADIVRRTAQAYIAERGAPATPEQALEYVKLAYDEANKMVGKFRPAPKATAKQPSSVQQTSQSPKPEPQSMFDVVQQSLGA